MADGKRGAPIGNQNGKKARIFAEAIKRALARKAEGNLQHGLDRLADELVNQGLAGESWAIQEIGNRLDGKPAQALTVAGDDEGGPVVTSLVVQYVKTTNADPVT